MRYLLAIALVCFLPATFLAAVHQVPRLPDLVLDGIEADWGDRGFRIEILTNLEGTVPQDDLAARARLAWDDQGLWVLIQVTDNVPLEDNSPDRLYLRDSVELFLATGLGSNDFFQVVFAPGLDLKHPELRQFIADRRSPPLRDIALNVQAARQRTEHGYVLEVLLPWNALGIRPVVGREVAFQLQVNDTDAPGARRQWLWHPATGAYQDTTKMERLVLSTRTSPAVTTALSASYEHFRHTRLAITAIGNFAGKTARVFNGRHLLGEAKLTGSDGYAVGTLRLPMPPREQPWSELVVRVSGQPDVICTLPDANAARALEFKQQVLRFEKSVFAAPRFPKVDFEQPGYVEDLVGAYTIRTAFYDAQFNPATVPAKPGRYGAVVEVQDAAGHQLRREFITLYRTTDEIKWSDTQIEATVSLPACAGIPAAYGREYPTLWGNFFKGRFFATLQRDAEVAVMLAGMAELTPGSPDTERNSPWRANQRWWFALKKRIGLAEPLRYASYIPADANSLTGQRWPTILYLHGSGDRGNDLTKVAAHGPLKIARTRTNFPFIVIAPQCPADRWWDVAELTAFLDDVLAKYPVDPDRLYLTGLSLGGFGSWELATETPDRFAAVVPISGGGDTNDVARLRDLPIWAFHGGKDSIVPVEYSTSMVAALEQIQSRVRCTVYPEAGHDAWTATYANAELYTWLLQQVRGHPQQPRVGAQNQ